MSNPYQEALGATLSRSRADESIDRRLAQATRARSAKKSRDSASMGSSRQDCDGEPAAGAGSGWAAVLMERTVAAGPPAGW